MPIADTVVGGQLLPLPAPAPNGLLVDPAVAGLLDFAAYMIKWELDPALAQVQGPTTGAPIADACPTAARYPFDPDTTFVRKLFPALYAWWDGRSVVTQLTTLYGLRSFDVQLLYVFPETMLPDGAEERAGLMAAVDRAFAYVGNVGAHPLYGYNGAPPGTLLANAIGARQLTYSGGEAGFMAVVPSAVSGAKSSEGQATRGYPSLRGTFRVEERVGIPSLSDPEDVGGDIRVTVRTGLNLDDVVPVLSKYLPAADGSEQP